MGELVTFAFWSLLIFAFGFSLVTDADSAQWVPVGLLQFVGRGRLPILVLLLSHLGCVPQTSQPPTRAPGPRQPSPRKAAAESRPAATTAVSLPTTMRPEDAVDLRINAVASGSELRTFRLLERSEVWMAAPGCLAAGIVPRLLQSDTEVARLGETNTMVLPSGVYVLTFSNPSAEVGKRAGSCTAFFQVHYLTAVACSMDVARFGVLSFDLETPSVESIGDLNADGRADYKVTFSASPSQLATRVVVGQEGPGCVRTVFEGVGHVVASNEVRGGWRRLYFLDTQYLAPAAPEWLMRTHGSSWSVSWLLDYVPGSQSYLKRSSPVRCERTDGVQRVWGDSGSDARATLIPRASCQPRYWELTNENR